VPNQGGIGPFVSWDGALAAYWPRNGIISGGQPGYQSIAVTIDNWFIIKRPAYVRVFWYCLHSFKSAASATAAAVAGPNFERIGDKGDDSFQGNSGDNALVGHLGDDRLSGGDGEDHLRGGRGEDTLSGDGGDDHVYAGPGPDIAVGGDGNDELLTGKGSDVSRGGPGKDRLFDDEGHDRLIGGPGNDRFSALDGERDVIDCGPGEDIAIIDRFDVATGCEHVYSSRRETPKKLPRI
jgi:Ca2+-binding RTX toxin-like protein